MSGTASKSPPNDALIKCHERVRYILPNDLAKIVLDYFPDSADIECDFAQSTVSGYRKEGYNSVAVDYEQNLYFRSANFGVCCGSQLLVNFEGSPDSLDFIRKYFKAWCNKTQIPHFGIFVKYIVDDKWVWRRSCYEAYASCGVLIKEWRNPLYMDHLLCMYEFCNHEKYDSFLNDLNPVNRRIKL